MTRIILLLAIGLGSVVALFQSAYVLPEGRQAIITQFGRPVGKSVTEAGLHFKTPFVQDVRYVDKRILSWDGNPNQIPTKDKKYISVDTTARWRVTDALKFIQTVQNERGAKARLDSILDANTRDVISNHDLVEAVRDTNQIFEDLDVLKKAEQSAGPEVLEEVSGEIEKVKVGREKLSQLIAEKADKELERFGIKLIDVQLRRIAYEKSVEQKVYERMISERNRIAEKIRSIGKGEKAKIEGRLSRDLQQIESEAYRKAQVILGKAKAEANGVYAKALNKDPEFFDFIRKMDAYKKTFNEKTKLILGPNSEFLSGLKRAK